MTTTDDCQIDLIPQQKKRRKLGFDYYFFAAARANWGLLFSLINCQYWVKRLLANQPSSYEIVNRYYVAEFCAIDHSSNFSFLSSEIIDL
jgi:hypothetical protein